MRFVTYIDFEEALFAALAKLYDDGKDYHRIYNDSFECFKRFPLKGGGYICSIVVRLYKLSIVDGERVRFQTDFYIIGYKPNKPDSVKYAKIKSDLFDHLYENGLNWDGELTI